LEVSVPVGGEVFRKDWKVRRVCSVAWNCLLRKKVVVPRQLWSDFRRLSSYDKNLEKKYKQDLNEFWKGKSEKELWDALFLEKCINGCTDILLRHSLDGSLAEEDPIEKEKWWKPLNVNIYRPLLHDSPIPCDGCSGR
jgi:hypothetical protein